MYFCVNRETIKGKGWSFLPSRGCQMIESLTTGVQVQCRPRSIHSMTVLRTVMCAPPEGAPLISIITGRNFMRKETFLDAASGVFRLLLYWSVLVNDEAEVLIRLCVLRVYHVKIILCTCKDVFFVMERLIGLHRGKMQTMSFCSPSAITLPTSASVLSHILPRLPRFLLSVWSEVQ